MLFHYTVKMGERPTLMSTITVADVGQFNLTVDLRKELQRKVV